MAIETCGRCGSQTAKLVKCDYCNTKICNSCIKSQKRKKVGKRYICKGCWGKMPSRNLFKGVK
ncbi:MAG: hypothetical protein ACP5N9_01670 [Candidatus Bilamarchaeum sp.]